MTLSNLLQVSRTVFLVAVLTACPRTGSGPDKTIAGGVLGAAWGAGAGAVVGHQFSHAGEGVAIGAGLGAVGGAMAGAGYDAVEETLENQETRLEDLRIRNALNGVELERIQDRLDTPPQGLRGTQDLHKVFFDTDVTSLKAGAAKELETIAESIKRDPYVKRVIIAGHSDDAGSPDYNKNLSEARARSVVSYLSARGVALDILKVESYGSTQPLSSNSVPEGRQMNRRVEVIVVRY